MSIFVDEDSDNNFQCEELIDFQRSKSNMSLFGSLLLVRADSIPENKDKDKSMVLDIETLINKKSENYQAKVFKKSNPKRKGKGKQNCYKKNICGYITKKIIRQFVSDAYKNTVLQLCKKYSADYVTAKAFYLTQIERVTGPSHISGLLQPNSTEDIPMKRVFRDFFQWFLKERYIRCLMLEGKMDHKQIYIRYKNEVLLQILIENYGVEDASETDKSTFSNYPNI